jgi:hypothetical protein
MPPKPPKQSKQPKLGICSHILRPTQKYKNICWFLAIIVIMFYSQRSRKVIMESSKTWDIRSKAGVERTVFSLFRKLLYERYLIVGDEPANSNEYKTFNENTFVEILKQLRVMNNKAFPYNPDDNEPYFMDSYIYKLYNLLGVDCKMFDYIPDTHELYYSSINKEFDRNISISSIDNKKPYIQGLPPYILSTDVYVYKDDKHAPTILIITIEGFLIQFKNNKIYDDKVFRELTSMKEEITYNGVGYILDSVYLVNANETDLNHAIVGMTCKKKKFVYNGEPVNKRNFPCVLMRHDWNILQDRDFYLWDNDCELHDKPTKADENRYNFSEGKRRRFIYVRKNESRDTSVSKETDVEKYRQEQRDAISREQIEAMLLEKARLEKVKLEKTRLRYEEQMKEEERRNAIARERKERRDAARLEEEIKKARLRYEEQMKAMKEEEERKKKKKEYMWGEKEEVEHYKEQMALIKKEEELRISDERKRVSDERCISKERKIHKSTQQRKYDIADLIEIMSKLKLEDDEKENHLPKRNEKRNRTNRSGSDDNSGSKNSPKVIKHPKNK